MNAFLIYILEVNVYIAIFALCYYFLFRNEPYHRMNRWVILGCISIAFLIPALPLNTPQAIVTQTINLDPVLISAKSDIAHTPTGYNFPSAVSLLYLIGFTVSSVLILIRIRALLHLLRMDIDSKSDKIKFVTNASIQSPASIFKTIFLNGQLPEESRHYIVAHERVHIREKHSLDVLFMQAVQALCWFNPAIYSFRKALEASHEFRADEVVAQRHPDIQKYSKIILSQALDIHPQNLTHQFSKPNLLKRRIMMLSKQTKRRTSLLKYLILIPIIGGALILNACTETENQDTPKALQSQDKAGDQGANATNSEAVKVEGTDVYSLADVQPEYPGGQKALMQFLSERIKYPESCKQEGVEGTVYIGFVIDRAGNPTDMKVLKSPDERLSANAMGVLAQMPQWTPGKVDGETVKVQYNLPVKYQLRE